MWQPLTPTLYPWTLTEYCTPGGRWGPKILTWKWTQKMNEHFPTNIIGLCFGATGNNPYNPLASMRVKHQISGQSSTVVKGCMYTMFNVVYILPLVMKEVLHTNSSNLQEIHCIISDKKYGENVTTGRGTRMFWVFVWLCLHISCHYAHV